MLQKSFTNHQEYITIMLPYDSYVYEVRFYKEILLNPSLLAVHR